MTEQCSRWQESSSEVTRRLLDGTASDAIDVLLGSLFEAARGDVALVTRREGDSVLHALLAEGGDELPGHRVLSIMGTAETVLSGEPVIVAAVGAAGVVGDPPASLMSAPLPDGEQEPAALVVRRPSGVAPFDAIDLEQLALFASRSGVALQIARARPPGSGAVGPDAQGGVLDPRPVHATVGIRVRHPDGAVAGRERSEEERQAGVGRR
jgi:hypothetical protein